MSIDLTAYERGEQFSGNVDEALHALRERLADAQRSQIVHDKRVIIVLEGREGAGKTRILRHLAAALDPRFFAVCTTRPDRRQQSEGHWLARFWAALPKAGHSTFFYHSWYSRVLEDRILDLVSEKEWGRAYDEINEFEAQQRDYGTLITKLFLHVTDAVQDERLSRAMYDPWQQWMLGPAELRTPEARERYHRAATQMFEQNHTRWSPWTVIDANNAEAATVGALGAIVEGMEKAFPQSPPQEPRTVIAFRASERA